MGPSTFGRLADGAPGISRTLLTTRLRELERLGIVSMKPREVGRGFVYELTETGRDLGGVLDALGRWGETWLNVAPEHADPGYLLNAWCRTYLAVDLLPDRRVVVRFDFDDLPGRNSSLWMILDRDHPEVCRQFPGFDEDLVVAADSVALAEWHLGRIEWVVALSQGRSRVSGSRSLAKALPTWNRRSFWATQDLNRRVSGSGKRI